MENNYTWGEYIKDYWFLLRGRRVAFVFYTILRALSDLAPFAIAYFLGQIIDFFTNYNAGESLSPFYLYIISIAFVGATQVWLRFYSKVRMQTIAAKIRKETRILAMNKLVELDLKWHEEEDTGSKIQKINHGGESVYQGLKDFSNAGITILISVFGALILFLTINPKYFLFAITYSVLYFFGEKQFNKKLSWIQDELNKIKERVSGKITESASNINSIKALGLNEKINENTLKQEDEYYNVWKKSRNISQNKFKTLKIFSAIIYASFILLLGLDFVQGIISLGSIYVFASYFGKLKGSLGNITNEMSNFISVKSGVGRFMTIIGIKKLEDESKLQNFPTNWKRIEFKNVTFKYKDKYVLKDFKLVINRGDKIGIVGKSGTGKSTIAKLLLKLYKPERGEILIDSKNINKINQQTITQNISLVMQEPEMFNTTMLENITITSIKQEPKLIEKAIKTAKLKPVIQKLPQKINTLIGERGYQLSGGERQRVGIARAIYKDAPILLLDEATSALDSKTEQEIQKELNKKQKDKTLLIIAHRISTLQETNKIIVLDKGKIIEQGTYKELQRNKKGKFNEIYKAQRR